MLNSMKIQGRLTQAIELRKTASDKSVVSFTIAWNERYKEIERTLFLPCVAWGGQAEVLSKYFDKGSEIIAEGYLTTRKWTDNEGKNRVVIEMTVEKIHFCGAKKDASGTTPPEAPAEVPTPPAPDFEITPDDEDLPF